MSRMRFLSVLFAILLGSQVSSSAVAGDQPTIVPADTLSEIRAAPETLILGNATLRMEAYAWRNFMPMAGVKADSRPLSASIKLIVARGPMVPHRVTGVWILQDESIWQLYDMDLPGNSTANPYEIVVRDGPRLAPHSYIDIVVRIGDAKSGAHFLSVRRQVINAVE